MAALAQSPRAAEEEEEEEEDDDDKERTKRDNVNKTRLSKQ